jgi:molybdopterin synthase catalytic subunit
MKYYSYLVDNLQKYIPLFKKEINEKIYNMNTCLYNTK